MANWVRVAGGPIINFDNAQGVTLEGSTVVIQMLGSDPVKVGYPSVGAAAAVLGLLTNALLNPLAGNPALSSVTPSSFSHLVTQSLTVTGTGFRTSAAIAINAVGLPTTFVSSNTLSVAFNAGAIPAGGPYDTTYSDSAGGNSTLVGNIAIS